jgi:hypothetical protein
MEQEFSSYLDYIKDPELKKKLTPDYNLGCTRIPKSDKNYYEAVQLPNAHIVKGQITSIVPDGVVMADGTQVKLDVLVYATGFDAHAYMRPMNVTGLNGTTIHEAWKEKIYSYGGIALPGFPNLFMLYGPFAPVNNVPVPLGLDQEIAASCGLLARPAPAPPQWHPLPPRRTDSSLASAAPFPEQSGSAAARIGTPASSPRRSCGPSRRVSTRRSSSRCPWTISSSFPAGRETDRAVRKAQPRPTTPFFEWPEASSASNPYPDPWRGRCGPDDCPRAFYARAKG